MILCQFFMVDMLILMHVNKQIIVSECASVARLPVCCCACPFFVTEVWD